MRPSSISADGLRVISDGLRVIERGHSRDPRVPDPLPSHAHGAAREELPTAKLEFATWNAGLVIGQGEDACSLLDQVEGERDPELQAGRVAEHLAEAVPVGACRPPADWATLWRSAERRIHAFLLALERQAAAPGLARRARVELERLAIARSTGERPLTLGASRSIRLDLSAPIADVIDPEGGEERLLAEVELEGERMGMVELPFCDGLVASAILADASASRFYWRILRRFFERSVYPQVSIERGASGLSLRRSDLVLMSEPAGTEEALLRDLHDRVGWAIFLQELWGCPEWPLETFYDPRASDRPGDPRRARDGWLVVEASAELPSVEADEDELDVVLTVGAWLLAASTSPPAGGATRARAAGRTHARLRQRALPRRRVRGHSREEHRGPRIAPRAPGRGRRPASRWPRRPRAAPGFGPGARLGARPGGGTCERAVGARTGAARRALSWNERLTTRGAPERSGAGAGGRRRGGRRAGGRPRPAR